MGKLYRTANGKQIDIEALRLKNENTAAVGNMRVNARGDELTPDGRVIKNRSEAVADNYYNLHTAVPTDDDIVESSYTNAAQADVDDEPAEQSSQVDNAPAEATNEPSLSKTTAAQQTKETTEVKSTRERNRSITGVKRL
jgi:hypothetical protein